MLPRSIAERLKNQTETIADSFSSASILFADVVDFTPMAEKLSPAEVVGLLDHLFGHFDDLVERYDLEKIKTIGDCYMAAAGHAGATQGSRGGGAAGPRHAGGGAREMATMGMRGWSCASASTRDRWWRASSVASGSCTTCGAMR